MKKIFTLIAAVAMTLGANAQLISFGTKDAPATLENSYEVDGFKLTRTDTDGKHAIDANTATFGTVAEPVKFETRLKMGGKSSAKNALTLTVPSAGTLKVYVRTGSNSATDRNVVLEQNGTPLYNSVVQESDVKETIDNGDGTTTNVYPVITVAVVAGSINVSYPVNGLNFYGFEFVAGEGGGEQGGGEQGGGEVTGSALIDYPTSQAGIAVSGTTTVDNVKLHMNKVSTPGIKFANSYVTNEASNGNHAELTVDGGFKAGDVVKIAGAFNNTDETKVAKVDLFTLDGTTPTVLFTTQQFINGRTTDVDPTSESFTLTADAEKLYIGRNGNTGTFVTLLKVERSGADGISQVLNVNVNNGAMFNLAGQQVSKGFKGMVIMNGKKFVVK